MQLCNMIPSSGNEASYLTSYISASTNRHSRAADVSSSSLVAFGSGSLVGLWRPSDDEDLGITETLTGHAGIVTCVRFGQERGGNDILFTGDDKGTLKCWRNSEKGWANRCTITPHSSPISALAIHKDLVVIGSSDSSISVWRHSHKTELQDDVLDELSRVDLQGRYPLDIHASVLPDSERLILAVAATDRNVSLWVYSDNSFAKAASLSGHEDWVKCLAFHVGVVNPDVLTLASGSQDGSIRLWNIEKSLKDGPSLQLAESDGSLLNDELLDNFEASLGDVAEGEEGGKQISLKRHIITVKTDAGSVRYAVTFDALLVGHEASVTSLAWRPMRDDKSRVPVLLSTSTDSSLILWSQTSIKTSSEGETTSLWVNQQRFGDVGGQRLGGFVGGLWTSDGNSAAAWGWAGGWRRWKCMSGGLRIESQVWEEKTAVTGHRGSVQGLNWTKAGEYLISAGPDQTTRIHAPTSRRAKEIWREVARPQVHGYDLIDAVFLHERRFVSIGDEKVSRVFEAPKRFLDLSKHFGLLHEEAFKEDAPTAASVPPLGLSNKALSQDEVGALVDQSAPLDRPPFEGELASTTLWPEVEKIFGHGYELYALSAAHSGRYIATACKSTTAEHAGIRVYDAETWQLHGAVLEGHGLTVTRLAFSPDDRFLLSVSRDRAWILHRATNEGYEPFRADKSHTRIIWDCAWAAEGDIFATASRDKTVKLWLLTDILASEKKIAPILTFKLTESATAVAFAPVSKSTSRRLLAVGLESGEIHIYSSRVDEPKTWSKVLSLEKRWSHVAQVNRLSWRPISGLDIRRQLASCSEDGMIKVTMIQDSNTSNE